MTLSGNNAQLMLDSILQTKFAVKLLFRYNTCCKWVSNSGLRQRPLCSRDQNNPAKTGEQSILIEETDRKITRQGKV